MANRRENETFMPTIAMPPGETIRENMICLGMDQEELAARLGITTKHVSNVLNGNASITYDTALKLETVIGPSADFWMRLENQYQLDKTRLENQEQLEVDLEIVKNIPYKKMSDYGWVEEETDSTKKVINCRDFFGVAELSLLQESYNVMYRKQRLTNEISDLSVLAWLRKTEIEGQKQEVNQISRTKLKKLIPEFRELTLRDPEVFYPEIVKKCAESGVAVTLVKCLPKTYICGATIWRGDKAILGLSVRGKKADIFWFTFFHELAHLINHSKKEFHINMDGDEYESEADQIASNYLISENEYHNFLEKYNYKSKSDIIEYSKIIGIAPCILVGRLMHEKVIDYSWHNDLRPSFEIMPQSQG